MLRIATLVLGLSAGAALAAPEFFRVADLQRGAVLTIRERPDAEAQAVGEIPWNGRGIRGFGCTADTPSGRTWCRVKYGNAVGWARRRYLQPE
jgi:uncharacterized protein YraI